MIVVSQLGLIFQKMISKLLADVMTCKIDAANVLRLYQGNK